ncbi:hypothetical protein Pla163_30980 [Planctomycetes bacterium Pla163]|uniref:Uncharacterized protein n=1 Tax=Rohdeia mirabilis TaxID=2528008 RepID=A0A518D394_9BACT|nr:hypothetical protein Pla163_30980 [Planctomycetes bacterium Pla163]
MKPVGIVFIVLNLILAAAFLGYTSHAHDVNKGWKDAHDTLQQEFEAEKARSANEASELRTEVATAEETSDKFREERDSARSLLDAANVELADLRDDNDELRSQVAGINSTLDSFRTDIETANNLRIEAQEARVAAEEERDAAKDTAAAAVTAQRNAEDEQRRLEQSLANLDLRHSELMAARDALQVQHDMLIALTGTDPADISSVPPIPATVVDLSHDINPGLVVLNVGKNRDVKRGMTFQIYRDGTYKGEVRVDNVDETMCSALIVLDNGITQGDSANTRLY